jgi:drug/metabolite transporter (DMT)-like permease
MDERSGIVAAFGAALLYNLATVLQKSQAQREAVEGIRLVARLFTRPVWLLGVACQIAGLGLHVVALARAPVTVVQPIIAAGIVFLVILAALALGERAGQRELAGMAATMGGVALLLTEAGEPATLGRVPVAALAGVILVAAGLIAGLSIVSARVPLVRASAGAVMFGLAIGLAQGMSDALNRLMGAWLLAGQGWRPPAPMGVAALVGLLAFGGVGFVLSQDAFRRHRANTVVPSMQTAQLVVPVGIAVTLYGQALPAGPAATLGWMVAFGLIVVGIVVLSGSAQVVATLADGTP